MQMESQQNRMIAALVLSIDEMKGKMYAPIKRVIEVLTEKTKILDDLPEILKKQSQMTNE
jgi:hypothetical protein